MGQVASSIKTSEAPQATKKIEKKRVKVHVEDQGPQLSEEELKQMEREAKLQAEADREVEAHKAQLREKRRNLLHHQRLLLLWQAAGISQHGQLLQALQTP